jgi:hypothetical protein
MYLIHMYLIYSIYGHSYFAFVAINITLWLRQYVWLFAFVIVSFYK